MSGGFEDLIVWQRAMTFVTDVYRISREFPSDEKYGLTSQMRRAVVSVPSNIAEGHERHTTREYINFISTAEGSLAEVRTQLQIAVRLDYCSPSNAEPLLGEADEIRRMLNALRRSLNARTHR